MDPLAVLKGFSLCCHMKVWGHPFVNSVSICVVAILVIKSTHAAHHVDIQPVLLKHRDASFWAPLRPLPLGSGTFWILIMLCAVLHVLWYVRSLAIAK